MTSREELAARLGKIAANRGLPSEDRADLREAAQLIREARELEARVDADEDSIERARIGIEQGMKRIQEGDTDEALNELWFARICLGDPDCRLIREPAPPTLKGEGE